MLRYFHGRETRLPSLRLQQAILAIFLISITLWMVKSWPAQSPNVEDLKAPQPSSSANETSQSLAKIFGHTIENVTKSTIQAARIHLTVTAIAGTANLPLLHKLNIEIPGSSEIRVEDASVDSTILSQSTISTLIEIPVEIYPQPDANAFLFGVATTYTRLESALDLMAHWLSSTNTSLIAAMEPTSDNELRARVHDKAVMLNISLKTIDSDYEYLDRYFSLVRHLYANRTPDTRWCVLIDDDTFFLDLRSVISTFDKKYESSEPYYVGALTEDFQQMANWGYLGYGGGGVFLSHILVEQLIPHWTDCYKKRNTGDRMLAECIYKHTATKFTWEHNLHQLDLHGDQSGFYEALRPQPLSIHHWHSEKFDFHANIRGMSLVASICGNKCLLQKFKLGEDWILTNGYSIVQYSEQGTNHREIDTDISMERTWDYYYDRSSDTHFEHTLGPIRKMGGEATVRFRMESAFVDTDGNVRQLYVKRHKRTEIGDAYDQGEVEGLIEIIWSVT